MATFISHSPSETTSLGENWGSKLTSGSIIGLSGDLGAGKTQLVKGLARGLEITEKVHSPTFALVNEYTGGRLPLYHLDLYRLETRDQIIRAGLGQYFSQSEGVVVVEWIERWGTLEKPLSELNLFFRSVKMEVLNETDRRIIYEDFGS